MVEKDLEKEKESFENFATNFSKEELEEMGKIIDSIVEMGFPYFLTKEELENSRLK